MSAKNLETLIKIRHLANGLNSNWQQLLSAQEQTNSMIEEAQSIVELYATEKGRQQFKADFDALLELKNSVIEKLATFKAYIDEKHNDNAAAVYADFVNETDKINTIFSKISQYDDACFTEMSGTDWANMWSIIQSNLYSIKGLGEGAYIKLSMYDAFNQEEIDDLSKEIVKYIPNSFNIDDAIKYRKDYLEAVRQMEEEANKKDNLWDRFLNLLAGNVPFTQSPQERVMMMRWVNGKKGEL